MNHDQQFVERKLAEWKALSAAKDEPAQEPRGREIARSPREDGDNIASASPSASEDEPSGAANDAGSEPDLEASIKKILENVVYLTCE